MDHKYAWDEAYCSQEHITTESELKAIKRIEKNKKAKPVKSTVYWELANEQKIDIDTMTIEHLRNTLKLIVTRGLLKDKH